MFSQINLLRNTLIKPKFIKNNKNIITYFSTIENKNKNNAPLCRNCVHYNPVDSKCYAIKNIPILASAARLDMHQNGCGPDGKQYEYMGPELKKDRERVKENIYLSVSSLIICKLFIFESYPPYSMVICVLPLSLSAFYSILFLEQTYDLTKMEIFERKRIGKIKLVK